MVSYDLNHVVSTENFVTIENSFDKNSQVIHEKGLGKKIGKPLQCSSVSCVTMFARIIYFHGDLWN